MKKCRNCGGDLIQIGTGLYKCKFCGYEQEIDDTPKVNNKNNKEKTSGEGANIYEENIHGVLELQTESSRGSGYIINNSGYAITNYHVVDEDGHLTTNLTATVCGKRYRCQVISTLGRSKQDYCTRRDLALIRVLTMDSNLTPLKITKRDDVLNGEELFVIGNSLGYGNSITRGIVSNKNINGMVMYDSATNPGNSGGPIFDIDGFVVGTVSGHYLRDGIAVQGMNIGVRISDVKDFLTDNNISWE